MDWHDVLRKVRARNLTYLSDSRVARLVASIERVNSRRVEGAFIEAGCALGGSLVMIAAVSGDRRIDVFDTFEMIPPPGSRDPVEVHRRYAVIEMGKSAGIGGDIYYGYRPNLLCFVKEQINDCLGIETLSRITFHKGRLEQTMRIGGPVAFAHVDVDWFESVDVCVRRIWPLLQPGGVMVFDDYSDWGGCKAAVDEFFQGRSGYEFDAGEALHVTKTAW